jgi:hypothetical protein
MSEKITIRVNDPLKIIYNVDDPIFKALICDKGGIPESTIVKPTDFNLGAFTNNIEYLRRMSIDLLKQIFIDQASDEFLKYELETFFGTLQLQDETESQWIQRTISLIFQPRISRASIISALRDYSSVEPEIITGGGDSAFADRSFADRTIKYSTNYDGEVFIVYPSYAQTESSSFYSIVIILYDTSSSDLYTVSDIINKYIAAGISFKIEIR